MRHGQQTQLWRDAQSNCSGSRSMWGVFAGCRRVAMQYDCCGDTALRQGCHRRTEAGASELVASLEAAPSPSLCIRRGLTLSWLVHRAHPLDGALTERVCLSKADSECCCLHLTSSGNDETLHEWTRARAHGLSCTVVCSETVQRPLQHGSCKGYIYHRVHCTTTRQQSGIAVI